MAFKGSTVGCGRRADGEWYTPLYKEGCLEEAKAFTLRYPEYVRRDDSGLHLPATEHACACAIWLPQEVLLGTPSDMDTIVAAVKKVQDHASEIR